MYLVDTNVWLEVLLAQERAAEKHDLIIVSFDKDFDRTTRGRKTPAEIIGASA